jgi:hypothetical protein
MAARWPLRIICGCERATIAEFCAAIEPRNEAAAGPLGTPPAAAEELNPFCDIVPGAAAFGEEPGGCRFAALPGEVPGATAAGPAAAIGLGPALSVTEPERGRSIAGGMAQISTVPSALPEATRPSLSTAKLKTDVLMT